jgi:ParB/RepB/Spo0J family partition protein
MDMELKTITAAELRRQPVNPNEMSSDELVMLQKSIKRFGMIDPVIVQPNEDGLTYDILDGHHRLEAAIANGIVGIPCVVVGGYMPDEINALQLALNKNRGHIRLDTAETILRELASMGWERTELAVTGFSDDELSRLLDDAVEQTAKAAKAVSVEAPAAEDRPFTLELKFHTQEQLRAVRKALKRSSGELKDESLGMLNMLGLLEDGR